MSSVAVLLPLNERANEAPAAAARRDQILRFRRSERLVHWALAIPFMVCYTTALVLVTVYNPNPALPFRRVVSMTHRISGLCLFILPLWTLFRHRHEAHIHVGNIRQVWRWTRDDVKWLCLIGAASVCRRISLPPQGKFNAGEKINFMSLSATYSIYVLTGLCIWAGFAPVLAWLVHFSLATWATPLLFGHIAMATINPDTRPGLTGMITGFVDREWASHHYHHWYHEHFGAKVQARSAHRHDVPSPVSAPAAPLAATVPTKTDKSVTSPAARAEHPRVQDSDRNASSAVPAPAPASPAIARPVPARQTVVKTASNGGARRLVDGIVPDGSLAVLEQGADASFSS